MSENKVFVSYDHSEDVAYKNLLASWGVDSNYEFEFDERIPNLPIDSDEASVAKIELDKKMKESAYILIIIGKKSYTSKWMKWEIERAKEDDTRLKFAAIKIHSNDINPDGLPASTTIGSGFDFRTILDTLNQSDNLASIYDKISSNIVSEHGQCVLLLGPELSVDKDGSYYKTYFKQLGKDKNSDISHYFSDENLFAFVDDFGRDKTIKKIKNFYNNVGDKVLLEMISRIQFPLIINVCPDSALNNVYKDKGILFEHAYFSKDSKPMFNALPRPSKNLPVIYNIFGSISFDESLILTHGKLYETIEHLLPEKSLPDNIELFLKTASSFIFLGFKYDSWYYQLICHKLGLVTINSKKTSLSVPLFNDNAGTVNIVMGKHFNINFTQENPTQTIENIIEQCELRKPGALRQAQANQHYGVFITYARNEEKEDIIDLLITIIRNERLSQDEKMKSLADIFRKAHFKIESAEEFIELVTIQNDENLVEKVKQWYFAFEDSKKQVDPEQSCKREDIVDLIENGLKLRGGELLQVFRDRKELTYGDSIDSFMNRIGKGKTVIRVISDKYLKSRYCMDEALRIQRYNDKEKRIFTVVLSDVEFRPEEKIVYKKYWETMIENIYGKIDLAIENKIDKERTKRNYGIYIDIYDYIDDFINNIQDEVYLGTNYYKVGKLSIAGNPDRKKFDDFIDTVINKMKDN